MNNNCKIIFKDGDYFIGKSIGYKKNMYSEIVFNTSNLGYEEIITDPSYSNQVLVFTTPYIGNTGVNLLDFESNRIWLSCVIAREIYNFKKFSNFRTLNNILSFLKKNKVVVLTNFDTRKIVKKITKGFNKVTIAHNNTNNKNNNYKKDIPYLKYTSTKIKYIFNEFDCFLKKKYKSLFFKKVLIVDFGIKLSIIRNLTKQGIIGFVVNYKTFSSKIINRMKFKSIILSNGPGKPTIYKKLINKIKHIDKKIKILSICFGHQILMISRKVKIGRLKFGHHGSNHPIKINNKLYISTQNHNYYCCKNNSKIISLFDKTNQGIYKKNIMSLQCHPEANPGPKDLEFIFRKFFKKIK
ncbi:carbamoyl phosphate synthase small subunit [Candidatus Vidania fulgoroideorum]